LALMKGRALERDFHDELESQVWPGFFGTLERRF
jgi:hypothetical protein